MKVAVSVTLPKELYDRWKNATDSLNLSAMLEEILTARLDALRRIPGP